VPRLVEEDLDAAGQQHRRCDTEALLLRLAAELDPLRAQLGHRLLQVVAHQADLVLRRAIRGMDAHFRRWEREDQPARMILDVLPLEHVAQRGSHRLCLRRVQEHVRRHDRHQRFFTSAASLVIDSFASPKSITVFGL
jgi:hypothetical protein